MATLGAGPIAIHAAKAFGEPLNLGSERVIIAVAVALAESSGNTDVINRNSDGSTDVGLWQINSVHRRDHPTWTQEWLKNPDNNAQAMATVSINGINWRPWTQYRNGNYEDYLDEAEAVGENVETSGPGEGILQGWEAAVEALGQLAQQLQKAGAWMADSANWMRVVQIAAGGLILMVAANAFVRPLIMDTVKAVKPI